jgi:DNA helicase II / ATP-dependent DNA helicase PcrA
VWAGTFHAYGLELLRKYGLHPGFAEPPKLLDRTDIRIVSLPAAAGPGGTR